MSFSGAPAADQVEVNLFGPGRGESALIHLGDGNWIVIDSCLTDRGRRHPVLEYLAEIGVDPAVAIKLVVATHAHDDHIAGIAQVFAAAPGAYFVLPVAMTPEEFAGLVVSDRRASAGLRRRAYAEYEAVAQILKSRPSPHLGQKAVKFTQQDRILLQGKDWTVRSLSPSDEATSRALSALMTNAAAAGQDRGTTTHDPNELAAAIWVEAKGKGMLFGADLLVGPSHCGWEAVVASFSPNKPASLFKIPHHGSPGADSPEVWDRLVDNPLALLTPFRGGRRPLPASEDLQRIASRARATYAAAPTRLPTASDQESRAASSALSALGRHVRQVTGDAGHIRARSSAHVDSWEVVVRAPAYQYLP